MRSSLTAERYGRAALTTSGLLLLAASAWAAADAGSPGFDLLAGLMGSVAVALQARAGTGRWPSVAASSLDLVLVVLLAGMATGTAKLWQPPGAWSELATLTPLGAATSVGLYLLVASWLARRGGGDAPFASRVLVAAVPLLASWLLLLGSAPLSLELGRYLSAGLAVGPAVEIGLGRALVLLVFDLALIVGIGRAMDGRWTRDRRLLALVAGSALLAAFTPQVASLAAMAAAWPAPAAIAACVAAASLAQAGLWAQVFLVTGMALDALKGRRPTRHAALDQLRSGAAKGAVYGGVFILLAHLAALAGSTPWLVALWQTGPVATAMLAGAVLFPLGRTLVESFDGSAPFFHRLAANAREPWGYARGAVIGAGIGLALQADLPAASSGTRFAMGALLGLIAYAGTDLVRDLWHILHGPRARLQSWRVYALALLLGGVVGGAIAWYLDAAQLEVLGTKLRAYATVSRPSAENYIIYPLFSKYGALGLGPADGGVRLFFNESLSGVINWSLAAPLFSINLVLLSALVHRSLWPIRGFITPVGLVGLVEQAIRVMRWGLWMAPVIYTGLRMAPDPTWYNQDGAVRTLVATAASWWLPADQFRAWSLGAFLGLLAYDWLRVLIWFDHMGLRVATLVNLSFVGGDAADERAARFLGHPGHSRIVPEGLRRFATWAPLLIPFYIPRGSEWDHVWGQAEVLAASAQPVPASVGHLLLGYAAAGIAMLAVAALVWRQLARWPAPARGAEPIRIANGFCSLEMTADGRSVSRAFSLVARGTEIDLTRRSEDRLDGRGKLFLLRERDAPGGVWSLTRPAEDGFHRVERLGPTGLRITARRDGLEAEITAKLAAGDAVESWRLRLRDLEGRQRRLVLASYQELAIEVPEEYRRHPAYAALHVGTRFVRPLRAIIAHNRRRAGRGHRHDTAFHAVRPDRSGRVRLMGYQDARQAFLGRGTLEEPEGLTAAGRRRRKDEGLLFTFDPIASLSLEVELEPHGTHEIRFVDGYAASEEEAVGLIARHTGVPRPERQGLKPAFTGVRVHPDALRAPAAAPPFRFSEDGTELRVGIDTPRPWHHVLANPLGQGAVVSNGGEIFSFAGNAQQNGITPFTLDSVAAPNPAQGLYLAEIATGLIDTPTFVPHRRADAAHEVVFGRGYATFLKSRPGLEQELTVFIPPHERVEVRLLRLRNTGSRTARFRVVPYAQLVLAELAADSRHRVDCWADPASGAVFARNGSNDFEGGTAFVATSLHVERCETVRSRFLGGAAHDPRRPFFVERGEPDAAQADDGYRVAAMAGMVEVAPGATASVVMALGQAASDEAACAMARAWREIGHAEQALLQTRRWWAETLSSLRIETNHPAFDRMVNDWLPYQALTARLWGRCGPSQRGGATGYRDQLQDVLPFLLTQPELARAQILRHAAQQFPDGDVLQWWHRSRDGRTGIAARNRIYDIELWLPYLTARYLQATGDAAVLHETVPFLEGKEIPAGADGIVMVPRPSREAGSLYDHCRRAIEVTLGRLGPNGLPLIGTGDWNDGLNRVGHKGRGESVWLGFLLHDVLRDFAEIAGAHEGPAAQQRYQTAARRLQRALDGMWRGERYARAVNDAGQRLAYADALTGAWPVLSGAAGLERGLAAFEGALAELERPDMVLLLTPPFGPDSRPAAGKIAHYPEGVRENGGQYSHGSSWLIDAAVRLSELAEEEDDQELAARLRAKAVELWVKISPLRKTEPERLWAYGLPPHQQPADIYDGPGREGRGGWSWYTGSAARMLQAAYAILGLRMENGVLIVPPDLFEAKGELRVRRLSHRGHEILPETPAPVRTPV